MHTQNGHLSEVITTFSTGLTALNGLTEQVQYFSTGTAGTDFNIASAVNTHTFNLPTASAINRGALSSADWITFNSKANASGTTNYVSKFTGANSLGDSQIFDNGTNVGIGTTNPSALLSLQTFNNYAAIFNTGNIPSSNTAIGIGGYTTSLGTSGGTIRVYHNHGSTLASQMAFEVNGQEEKMRIASNGNVGIGTTSPARTLHVLGQTGIGTVLKLEGATGTTTYLQLSYNGATNSQSGYIGYDSSSNMSLFTNDSERMRIASNGAIKFNAYGSGSFTGTATQRLAVDSSGNVIEIPIGGGAVDGSGTTNYVTKWTDADTIGNSQIFDNGANVGIGTNIPSAAFQVGNGTGLKNILISGSGNNLGLGGLSVSFLGFATGTISTVNTSGAVPLGVGTRSTQPLVLGTNNAERMRIDSSGNVGIGTTDADSKFKVEFNPSGTVLAGLRIGFLGSSTNYYDGDTQIFRSGTGVSERMRITSNGNVGIGTTNPSALLSLQTFNNYAAIFNTGNIPSSNTAIGIGGYTTSLGTSGGTIRVYHNHGSTLASQMAFEVNGQEEKMRIASNGNVGIGTTSPIHKLSVNGKIGGDVFSDSFLEFTSGGNTLLKANDDVIIGYSQNTIIKQNGNVGIGTTSPNASAILHLKSNSKGFLPPSMSTADRDNIGSPLAGLMIFNEEDEVIQVFTNGSGWKTLAWA
jgi:hypothetical protein